jgi:predicted transcriptional regulator
MNDVFKALADENRRHLLDMLRERDGQTLNELCGELAMSRQAVSKHLRILEQAGLVNCLQTGRNKHHYLNPIPLQEIVDRWLSEFRQSQAQALTQLKKNLESPL